MRSIAGGYCNSLDRLSASRFHQGCQHELRQLKTDPFAARDTFDTGSGKAGIYRLSKLEDAGLGNIAALPYSIRVLLESLLRNCDGYEVTEDDVKALAGWNAAAPAQVEIPFKPARVVLQDFTGVPCVVDLAAMRSAMQRLGGDPKKINPLVPVDLVIDHSVQVDYFDSADALDLNIDLEFDRNRERYEFLRWGQKAFDNFRVVPPGIGIVHQVNLEYLAKVVFLGKDQPGPVAFPDSLVGTDSHTTMINGLGVVGWGVGGIEAEGVMLGQPLYMLLPEVVGLELTGKLPPGATATDLVLTVTQILRKESVVGKFVEFFGPACRRCRWPTGPRSATWRPNTARRWASSRSTTKRSTTSARPAAPRPKSSSSSATPRNKACSAPTTRRSRRSPRSLRLDLSTVEPCLAGPKRPQDRVPLANMKPAWQSADAVYGKRRRQGSPEGRWEGEGGHKIESPPPIRRAPPIPASTASPSTGTARRSTSSTAPSSSPPSPVARTPATRA